MHLPTRTSTGRIITSLELLWETKEKRNRGSKLCLGGFTPNATVGTRKKQSSRVMTEGAGALRPLKAVKNESRGWAKGLLLRESAFVLRRSRRRAGRCDIHDRLPRPIRLLPIRGDIGPVIGHRFVGLRIGHGE